MKTITTLCLALCLATALIASDQVPGAPQKGVIALKGATIHPVVGDTVENGVIVFENGKITALGADAAIPGGAQVIDVSGKHIYPGLIESSSILGLVEINAVRATRDSRETGPINPNVEARVAVNPDSEQIPVTRANGIAIAASLPQGGLISGQATALMLDGWTYEDMTLKSPLSMIVNWPDMEVDADTPDEISKQEKKIAKQLKKLEDSFDEAAAYRKEVQGAAKANRPKPPTDLRWEDMIPVLEGKLPVWIQADSVKQIRAALAFAKRRNLKMVLLGGRQAPLIADQLVEHKVPVIIQSVMGLPDRRDLAYDSVYQLPLKLHEAGVSFCIAANSGFGTDRNLPYHAAMAASYGLPVGEALKSVTLYPAQIMGVADQVGSLEVGKDATLIVTDGHPLEIVTHTKHMFIQGRKVDLSSRHTLLYDKYKEKYQQTTD